MNDDPADVCALARKHCGLSRELEVDHAVLPHPSRGGSRGYPVWHRMLDLERAEQNQPTDASAISHWRWRNRLLPFRMTGNKQADTIVGADQILVVMCLTIWPDSTADKIVTFVYNEGGGVYTDIKEIE